MDKAYYFLKYAHRFLRNEILDLENTLENCHLIDEHRKILEKRKFELEKDFAELEEFYKV